MEEKRKRGQPRKVLDPETVELIGRCAASGCTLEQIAMICKITKDKMTNWIRKPEVVDVYEQNKAIALQRVGETLYQKAIAGDIKALLWYERSRTKQYADNLIANSRPVQQTIIKEIPAFNLQLDETVTEDETDETTDSDIQE